MDYIYRFPVVRGIQAGSEYYIAMVPLKMLSKLFSTDEEVHIAKLNGRICGAKRSHSVSEQPNCYQSV